MKLSTRTKYGLRALLIIAQSESGVATSENIAQVEGLSKKYLDSILGQLRQAGILKTNRGVNGGYSFLKKPEETTVLDIFLALEKNSEISACVSTPDVCDRAEYCPGRGVWQKVYSAISNVMSEITVEQLVKDEENNLASKNLKRCTGSHPCA